MNWYKESYYNVTNLIARDIVTWLEQAYQGNVDFMSLDDDISMRMSGIDDMNILSDAIVSASNIVSEKQGGELSPEQNQIITMLRQRIS